MTDLKSSCWYRTAGFMTQYDTLDTCTVDWERTVIQQFCVRVWSYSHCVTVVLPVSPALPPQSLAVWNLPLDQHKNESIKLFRNLSICFSPPSGFPARVTRKHYTDLHITATVNMGTDLAYNFVFKGKIESVDWRSYSSYDTFNLRQFLWSEW